MSKLFLLLVAGALAALILGGALEVRFHPDKLSNIPQQLSALTKDQSAVTKSKLALIKLKRSGEWLVFRDKEKRLEIAVLNVGEDAGRLQEALAGADSNPDQLLPYAQLLLDSIEKVRGAAQEAPASAVASMKEESTEAFLDARAALGQLQDVHEEYQTINEEFSRLTKALEEQVGTMNLGSEQGNSEQQGAETEQSSAPLRF
jgi:hypothetical protein